MSIKFYTTPGIPNPDVVHMCVVMWSAVVYPVSPSVIVTT